MTPRQLLIDASSAGLRLDVYLARHWAIVDSMEFKATRTEIQRRIGAGEITINGVLTKSSARLKVRDRIDIRTQPEVKTVLRPEAIPLDILYEDVDCIVINKAPGIVVHPAAGRSSGTLVNALLHHFPQLAGMDGESRPGIVHRLDKDTSGVMIIAKHMRALQHLVAQFKMRNVHKEYVALVYGRMAADKGIIDRPIGRHRSDRKRMSSTHHLNKKRDAVTEWVVDERFALKSAANSLRWLTLLTLTPRTGRTHQIRVHLADLGYPLVGDPLYGQKRKDSSTTADTVLSRFPRQALHSKSLAIALLGDGKRVEFVAPLPDDLKELLQLVRGQQSRGRAFLRAWRNK